MTGYTQQLVERNLNFKDFALLCTRAFGFCSRMREEDLETPIPEEFKASDYHEKLLELKTAEYNRLKSLSRLKAKAWAENNINAKIAQIEVVLSEKEREKESSKCAKMLKKVHSWTPPTEEHEPLKKFMLDQLKPSNDNWDYKGYYEDEIKKLKEKKEKLWTYYQEQLEKAKNEAAYHKLEWEKEVAWTMKSNNWLKELRESLE